MASDILNRVGMVITTTGTGPVTANVLISNRFNTPAEAGALNGASYWWMLEEDNDYQIFEGVWTLSSTSVARTTTWMSKIGGVKGTANMNLAGNATLRSITPAEAFDFILRVDKDQTAQFSSGQKTQGRNNIGAAKSGANTDITSLGVLNAAISTTAKGSTFGGATGTNTAPAVGDANIKLYDNGGGNWAGLVADGSGSVGIRVGLSGSPDSAFLLTADGDLALKKDLSWVGAAMTAYTPTQTGTATGTASGRYKYLGKTLILMLRFAATSTGTVILSLPAGVNTAGLTGSGAGRENGLTGVGLVAFVQAGKVVIGTYAAANPTGNGAVAEVAMIIEVA